MDMIMMMTILVIIISVLKVALEFLSIVIVMVDHNMTTYVPMTSIANSLICR